jgi:hypothetical protein
MVARHCGHIGAFGSGVAMGWVMYLTKLLPPILLPTGTNVRGTAGTTSNIAHYVK